MKKLLLTGASGFLGRYILRHVQGDWNICGLYHSRFPEYPGGFHQVDLTHKNAVEAIFRAIRPDIVIHTAALSKAALCEQNPAFSRQINVEVPRRFARCCAETNTPLIFTSTDLVFDGKNPPYRENDPPNPLSQYGLQKAEAEQVIMNEYSHATICRMPLMYGNAPYTNNFFLDWMHCLKNGILLKAFTDEYRTPVHAVDAVRGLFLLLEKEKTGIWHLGGKASISRYNFAMQMVEVFGFAQANVQPLTQAELNLNAPRPADVSMDSSRAFELGYAPDLPAEVFGKMTIRDVKKM